MRSSNMGYPHEERIGPEKRPLRLEPPADLWKRYPSRHADFRGVIIR